MSQNAFSVAAKLLSPTVLHHTHQDESTQHNADSVHMRLDQLLPVGLDLDTVAEQLHQHGHQLFAKDKVADGCQSLQHDAQSSTLTHHGGHLVHLLMVHVLVCGEQT